MDIDGKLLVKSKSTFLDDCVEYVTMGRFSDNYMFPDWHMSDQLCIAKRHTPKNGQSHLWNFLSHLVTKASGLTGIDKTGIQRIIASNEVFHIIYYKVFSL